MEQRYLLLVGTDRSVLEAFVQNFDPLPSHFERLDEQGGVVAWFSGEAVTLQKSGDALLAVEAPATNLHTAYRVVRQNC